tara:strand:- start:282 stop:521 length:240 start_codon:yes stop_codon:yes gene_type:complete
MTTREAFDRDEGLYCSIKVDDTRVMFYKGYKAIKQSSGEVRMYDTTEGKATYEEFTEDQYSLVSNYGWRGSIIHIKSNQ